jgi:hypothetical protein
MDQAQFNKLKQDQLDLETRINAELGKGAAASEKFLKESRKQFDENAKKLKQQEQERKIQDDLIKAEKVRQGLQEDTTNSLIKQIQQERKRLNANQIITDSIKQTKDFSSDYSNILNRIAAKEEEVLDSTSAKNIVNYDSKAVAEEISELKKEALSLDGEEKRLLLNRIGILQGEHKIVEKTAGLVEDKNALYDKLLGTLNISRDTIDGMKENMKRFNKITKKNVLFLIGSILIAMVGFLIKSVKAAQNFSEELNTSFTNSAKIAMVTETMVDFQLQAAALGGDISESAKAIFTATRGTRDVSRENVKALTVLAIKSGATEENIAKMARLFSDMGNTDFTGGLELVNAVTELAGDNLVDSGLVLQDMAENAEEFAAYTDQSMKNIAMAAVQAAKMGVELATTLKITDSLLDFETSITSAMEASMMIGRNINFDRARMLAIDNDIVGATNDIIQQLGSAEEFTRLNAIQRKKLAAAIGVEVGELSRLVAGKPLEITAKEQETKLQKESIGQMEELTKAMKELKNVISAGGKGLLGKKGDSTPTQTSDESNKEMQRYFNRLMNSQG